MQELTPRIEQLDTLGRELFGERWDGYQSNWDVLDQVADWLVKLHERVKAGSLPTEVVDFIGDRPDTGALQADLDRLNAALTEYEAEAQTAIEALELDELLRFGENNSFINLPYEEQSKLIQSGSATLTGFKK